MFEDLHVEGIFHHYAAGKKIDGLHNLTDTVSPILNFVFENGNLIETLDIFCTHDIQIELILLFIGYDKNKIAECWPRKSEGLFLWKEEGQYYAVWRGILKEIKL